jgi:dienelactone hydrolase
MRKALLILLIPLAVSCSDPSQSPSAKNALLKRHTFYPAGYPKGKGPFPAILLMPQRDNMAGKLADEGYVVMTMYCEAKGSDGLLEDADRLDRAKRRVCENLELLKAQPAVDQRRIGVIGLALSGYFATYLASKSNETGIRAAVAYYGIFEIPEHIANLRAPVLAFQGDADNPVLIKQTVAMERLARENKKNFELVMYKNAHRGFEFGVTPTPADALAVRDSWAKAIAFLNKNLK